MIYSECPLSEVPLSSVCLLGWSIFRDHVTQSMIHSCGWTSCKLKKLYLYSSIGVWLTCTMCLYKAHLRVCIICCWIAVFHSCVLSSPRLHHWELLATLWQAATNKPSWYWIMACCRTLKCCWDTLALIYRRWEWETSLGSMLHQLIESHRLQQTAWAA